jgi:hypothetical protein
MFLNGSTHSFYRQRGVLWRDPVLVLHRGNRSSLLLLWSMRPDSLPFLELFLFFLKDRDQLWREQRKPKFLESLQFPAISFVPTQDEDVASGSP